MKKTTARRYSRATRQSEHEEALSKVPGLLLL